MAPTAPPTTTPDPADWPNDPTRRTLLRAGEAALPAWVVGCGGGSTVADDIGEEVPQLARPAPMAAAARAQGAAAAGYPVRVRPTVSVVGASSIQGSAEATSAYWLVFNAGTDTLALAVLSGISTAASRVELAAPTLQGGLRTLQTDRPIVSIHVARAGQAGYTMTALASLSGSLVARWDFDESDQIRCVELLTLPAVVAGDLPELRCAGWAA